MRDDEDSLAQLGVVCGHERQCDVLPAALEFVRDGDALVITRLDRLDRSMKFMLDRVGRIEAKGVQLRSLGENLDTTGPTGRLVFHVFAMLAEFERGRISERTIDGLKAAKARGRIGGRPRSIPADMWAEMKRRIEAKDKVSDLARIHNVSRAAIYRMLNEDKAGAEG